MILGAEIAITLFGLMALINGKWSIGKEGHIIGGRARLLGALAVATVPVIVIVLFGIALMIFAAQGERAEVTLKSPAFTIGGEIGTLVLWLIFFCARQNIRQIEPRSPRSSSELIQPRPRDRQQLLAMIVGR